MTQQMKDAVKLSAENLLRVQNTVTTLEIKAEVRKTYPHFNWIQRNDGTIPGVGDFMEELANEGHFTFIFNGVYRVYSLPAAAQISAGRPPLPVGTNAQQPIVQKNGGLKYGTRISRKKAYELMTTNKGHFFTATFVDKKDKERTMNCQYMRGKQDTLTLGYIKVKESNKLKKGENPIRQINLQTLLSLKIGGQFYKISK